MASLKSLRIRMKSIQSTKKMTQAMKLVSASKLRKAKDVLEGSRPYAKSLHEALVAMLEQISDQGAFPIAFGRKTNDSKVMFLALGSDKGLCGVFNTNLVKAIKLDIKEFRAGGLAIEVICVGKKIYELLKHLENEVPISCLELADETELQELSDDLTNRFSQDMFDSCYVYYNKFISAMSQQFSKRRLLPLFRKEDLSNEIKESKIVECEPNAETLVTKMVPKILLADILSMFLENKASEHGARMTSMDSATRNAGEMLKKLNTVYNRTRQAAVTTELIEILSGAEAIKSN